MDEPRNQLRPVAEEPVRARTRDDEEDLKLLKQEYANAMAECRRFEQLAASNRLRAYGYAKEIEDRFGIPVGIGVGDLVTMDELQRLMGTVTRS